MGKKVIPEQVEYFCDICSKSLTGTNHKDFVVSVSEVGGDWSGSACGQSTDTYELCSECEEGFKDWLEDKRK